MSEQKNYFQKLEKDYQITAGDFVLKDDKAFLVYNFSVWDEIFIQRVAGGDDIGPMPIDDFMRGAKVIKSEDVEKLLLENKETGKED